MAIRLPANWNFIDAAAIPEVFLTAYLNLVWLGQMQAGQKVLIHAGASGVGTAAIQLVRALGGQALVTAGSKEKLERCQQLGAAAGWNYKGGSGSEESAKARSFVDFVKLQTDGDGVDLVLDFIGAPYFSDNLASLARGGKLVIIGTMGGANVKEFPLSDVLMRSLQVVGTTLRGQSLADKIRLTQEFSEFAMPLFATGQLKPIVDSVYPWTEAADAHRYMEANRNMGKIVLEITSKANEAGGKR